MKFRIVLLAIHGDPEDCSKAFRFELLVELRERLALRGSSGRVGFRIKPDDFD